MGIGLGVFLAVIGAILHFGITADVEGIDLDVIGAILMIAGGAIVVLTLVYPLTRRGQTVDGERPPQNNQRS
ncbi:DUF6458 family protein [Lipingzhangella sp. LS1_29]|uniref:DUF6458 family protein n=1 Tax=Lipingzhangella rawalii TaxID=2055835 RepID=A0ABU2H5F6_9ACTN|nr:DUF6458 family protein [Lipingzhangella rawalii]MDS1270084.1 DUF6458 family protein [Lipingzhangella rawalii]